MPSSHIKEKCQLQKSTVPLMHILQTTPPANSLDIFYTLAPVCSLWALVPLQTAVMVRARYIDNTFPKYAHT